IVLLGILESVVDDFNRKEERLQLEGARTGRELPGIVDQIITMHWLNFDEASTRAFVCTAPNPWNYPAKDRSGRLDQIEEPHLGRLLNKLTGPRAAVPSFGRSETSKEETAMVDLNNAGEQRSFDVVPDGTTAVVQMNIRPGNAGPDGLFKRS